MVFGSVVAFGKRLFVRSRWSASAVSYFFVLFPFARTAIAAVAAGEPVTGALLAGGVLVIAGVRLGALSGPRDGAGAGPVPPAAPGPRR